MAFSGTNRYVFKAYQYALGTGEIKNTNYQTNIKKLNTMVILIPKDFVKKI